MKRALSRQLLSPDVDSVTLALSRHCLLTPSSITTSIHLALSSQPCRAS